MGGGTGLVAFRPVSRQRYAFLVGEQEFDTRIVSDKERRHCPAAQSSRRWSGEIALQFRLGRPRGGGPWGAGRGGPRPSPPRDCRDKEVDARIKPAKDDVKGLCPFESD